MTVYLLLSVAALAAGVGFAVGRRASPRGRTRARAEEHDDRPLVL